jgi:uncharacterized protein YgiM (DUF1202 family)
MGVKYMSYKAVTTYIDRYNISLDESVKKYKESKEEVEGKEEDKIAENTYKRAKEELLSQYENTKKLLSKENETPMKELYKSQYKNVKKLLETEGFMDIKKV